MADLALVSAVADAIARKRGYLGGACVAEHYEDANVALAAVASFPGLADRLAEVLREHRLWRVEWDDGVAGEPECDVCWATVDPNADQEVHLADLMIRHLTGEAP